ncbi:hypothetical protein BDN72DRAFT_842764 [Pluteus cervinus]|uniref:Uncharacterized protein n=1 Tax=Pluteus cervinus TaxID=181527 RepID=A0ACD3APM6_9AGAR|nr:hypothetical protein BDN72DRAFT_842764 [Pluteus cervinus]
MGMGMVVGGIINPTHSHAAVGGGGGDADYVVEQQHHAHTISAFALKVDEVDKRRKSIERLEGAGDNEDTTSASFNHPSTSSATSASPLSPPSSLIPSGTLSYRLRRPIERESSATSTSSDEFTLSSPSPFANHPESLYTSSRQNPNTEYIHTHHLHISRQKSSPIFEEEDEDQLFPLPSPRRSPNASPTPSQSTSPAPSQSTSPAPSQSTSPAPSINPSPSPTHSMNPSPSQTPAASPNTSSSCFLRTQEQDGNHEREHGKGHNKKEGDCLSNLTGPRGSDELLSTSLSRKTGDQYLIPPSTSSLLPSPIILSDMPPPGLEPPIPTSRGSSAPTLPAVIPLSHSLSTSSFTSSFDERDDVVTPLVSPPTSPRFLTSPRSPTQSAAVSPPGSPTTTTTTTTTTTLGTKTKSKLTPLSIHHIHTRWSSAPSPSIRGPISPTSPTLPTFGGVGVGVGASAGMDVDAGAGAGAGSTVVVTKPRSNASTTPTPTATTSTTTRMGTGTGTNPVTVSPTLSPVKRRASGAGAASSGSGSSGVSGSASAQGQGSGGGGHGRRSSFTTSALWKAGAEVLKGVSTISSGGLVGSP